MNRIPLIDRVNERAHISDADVQSLRAAGFSGRDPGPCGAQPVHELRECRFRGAGGLSGGPSTSCGLTCDAGVSPASPPCRAVAKPWRHT